MTRKTGQEPARERIRQAAIKLFASQGYAATSMRQIVKEASVSLAMVNYHFGSKQQLFRTILEEFFEKVLSIASGIMSGNESAEVRIRRHLKAMFEFLRSEPELARLVLAELPYEVPGLVEFKAGYIKKIARLVAEKLLPDLPQPVRERLRLEIVGPAIAGALLSHFVLRPVVEKAFDFRFEQSGYGDFADRLADMMLYGLLGMAAQERNPA